MDTEFEAVFLGVFFTAAPVISRSIDPLLEEVKGSCSSSLVNVPCLTNLDDMLLLRLLLVLMLLIVLGVGEARGALSILDFWHFCTLLGEEGDASLILLICLDCIKRGVAFGDCGIFEVF